MLLKVLPVGSLKTNCYFLINPQNKATIIIDPADDADFLCQQLRRDNLKPQAIWLTHAHFDHLLALTELKLIYQIPFFLHPQDRFLLQQAPASARYWLGEIDFLPPPPREDYALKEGLFLSGGGRKWRVWHCPGHTPGSVVFLAQDEPLLLGGDLIFARGVGRTDFSYSDPSALRASLQRLQKLPPSTIIYPGHGKSFSLGDWLANNSFFNSRI